MWTKCYRLRTRGCKESLLIDHIITNHALIKTKTFLQGGYTITRLLIPFPSNGWLQLYRFTKYFKVIRVLLLGWEQRSILKTEGQFYKNGSISIRRGIYQGNSLSPLWSCLEMRPLRNLLNGNNYSYSIGNNLNLSY